MHVNRFKAAVEDPRFAPLGPREAARLAISVSVLGDLTPLPFENEPALLRALVVGEDGLLIRSADRQATFLPSVWRQLPEPREFLAALKRKAGLAPDFTDYEALRYRCEHFGDDAS